MESVKVLAKAAEKGKAPAGAINGLSLSDLRSELRSFGATLSECAWPSGFAYTPKPTLASKMGGLQE